MKDRYEQYHGRADRLNMIIKAKHLLYTAPSCITDDTLVGYTDKDGTRIISILEYVRILNEEFYHD